MHSERYLLLVLCVASLFAQTAPVTTIKSKVRVVVVDVQVTDSKGDPVPDLPKEAFEVREEGKPQIVSDFEEHHGAAPTLARLPPLPPHVFSNSPLTQNADAVNILLLDALNTPTGDQSAMHTQMLHYLKTIPPGTSVAIFTLATRLRMLQGVTTDSSELLAVLNDKKGAAGPHASPLLPSDVETQSNRQVINFMIETQGGSPSAAANAQIQGGDPAGTTAAGVAVDPIVAMQQFLDDTASYQTEARTRMTLQAMQQLARYLADIPGRKNLIWFSGSFPLGIFPDANASDPFSVVSDLQKEIRKTADLMGSAQVAIYPVGAEGIATETIFQANGEEVSGRRAGSELRDQLQQMHTADVSRDSNHAVMEDMAKATGGRAFYNTNDIKDVLTRVINDGSRYYTLSYTPANLRMNGKFRRIEVKLHNGGYKLSYRRGYYALDPDVTASAGRTADADPLLPLMGRNLPDFSRIVYKLRVLPANPQPPANAPRLGTNTAMKGPITRYSLDFSIPAQYLKLDPTPNGGCRGSIEVMLVAYDREGKPLNFAVTTNNMQLPANIYANVLSGGLQIHREIDIPKGEAYLRTGVYDLAGNTAGTIGVQLHETSATTAATK